MLLATRSFIQDAIQPGESLQVCWNWYYCGIDVPASRAWGRRHNSDHLQCPSHCPECERNKTEKREKKARQRTWKEKRIKWRRRRIRNQSLATTVDRSGHDTRPIMYLNISHLPCPGPPPGPACYWSHWWDSQRLKIRVPRLPQCCPNPCFMVMASSSECRKLLHPRVPHNPTEKGSGFSSSSSESASRSTGSHHAVVKKKILLISKASEESMFLYEKARVVRGQGGGRAIRTSVIV